MITRTKGLNRGTTSQRSNHKAHPGVCFFVSGWWRVVLGVHKEKPGTQPEGQAPSLVGVMIGQSPRCCDGPKPSAHGADNKPCVSSFHHPCETCTGGGTINCSIRTAGWFRPLTVSFDILYASFQVRMHTRAEMTPKRPNSRVSRPVARSIALELLHHHLQIGPDLAPVFLGV
jgi:hypothetical protein